MDSTTFFLVWVAVVVLLSGLADCFSVPSGVSVLLGLALGYALGRFDEPTVISARPPQALESAPPAPVVPRPLAADLEAAPSATRSVIAIDETKFVAPVSTDGMERVDTNDLGKTTVATDNLTESVSRLAQLKGN
jgi:hypothetical protein